MQATGRTIPRCLLVLVALIPLPTLLLAQGSFVYTNNNNSFIGNTVSAYSVAANGALTQLAASPFPTGGTGNGANGFLATNRIIACGNFLFVSNAYSGDVSSFSIDSNGNLTAVPGSPFPAGGTTFYGISLANLRCDFLFAGNGDAAEIFAFQIGTDGRLTTVSGSPFPVPSQPNSMKVSPDGKFLAASLTNLGSGAVAMFTVGTDGKLTPVNGSPFPISSANQTPGGIDINFESNLLFVAEFSSAVDVFNIASDGTIALVSGSPFSTPVNNSSATLSPSDQFLFTSDFSTGANSLQVATGGGLSSVAGSPFSAGLGLSSGVSVNSTGTLLFLSDPFANELSVMQVAGDGTLSLASGSPVITGQPGALFSLAAYPPKTSFAVATTPPSVTTSAGVGAVYSVTVTALGGTFDHSVALSCSLPPELSGASCQFSSASVTPGGNSVTSTLTVMTTGTSAGLVPALPVPPAARWFAIWLVPGVTLMMGLIGNPRARRRVFSCAPLFLLTFLVLALADCGGGASRSVHRTPAGTYTIMISGQSGQTTRTSSAQLVVQ